jgi:hypothetical protein
LLEANEENPVANITAVEKGFHAKSMTSDKAGGLLPVVYICKGAKVMLTANLCVPYGLSSGSYVSFPEHLALDNATKRAPGFLDSKLRVPG